MKSFGTLPLLLLCGLIPPRPPQSGSPRPGDVAPALELRAEGRALGWSDLEGKAVALVFEASGTRYEARSLEELLRAWREAPDLARAASLVVAVDDSEHAAQIAEKLQSLPGQALAAIDPGRHTRAMYGVVAFPTVFLVSPDRRIADVVRGYGSLLGHRVVQGARYAAGLLDEAEYRRSLQGERTASDPAERRFRRTKHLAIRLLETDRLDEAVRILEPFFEDPGTAPQALGFGVRAFLSKGRIEEAAGRLEELARRSPNAPSLPALRARLALARGDLEEARAILREVREDVPEIALARGLLAQAEGDCPRAAELLGRTLEELILRED